MRMTERVKEIMDLNLNEGYIPLMVQSGDHGRLFPIYFARMVGENQVAIPVTDATGIEEALAEATPAMAMVVDRPGGYEAYVLQGTVCRVRDEDDYEFVQAMQNEAPGFPIHGAVIFQVESASPVPPP